MHKISSILILSISLVIGVMGKGMVFAAELVLSDCEDDSVWKSGASTENSVNVNLDTAAFAEGKASVKITFDLKPAKEGNWMYCNIPVPEEKNDWTKFRNVTFHLKGDGKDNAIRIGIMDSEGELFFSNEMFNLSDAEWQEYTIALDEEVGFSVYEYYQPHKDKIKNPEILDLKGVKEFQIWVEDNYDKARQGSLNIDYINLSSREML